MSANLSLDSTCLHSVVRLWHSPCRCVIGLQSSHQHHHHQHHHHHHDSLARGWSSAGGAAAVSAAAAAAAATATAAAGCTCDGEGPGTLVMLPDAGLGHAWASGSGASREKNHPSNSVRAQGPWATTKPHACSATLQGLLATSYAVAWYDTSDACTGRQHPVSFAHMTQSMAFTALNHG